MGPSSPCDKIMEIGTLTADAFGTLKTDLVDRLLKRQTPSLWVKGHHARQQFWWGQRFVFAASSTFYGVEVNGG